MVSMTGLLQGKKRKKKEVCDEPAIGVPYSVCVADDDPLAVTAAFGEQLAVAGGGQVGPMSSATGWTCLVGLGLDGSRIAGQRRVITRCTAGLTAVRAVPARVSVDLRRPALASANGCSPRRIPRSPSRPASGLRSRPALLLTWGTTSMSTCQTSNLTIACPASPIMASPC